MSRAAPLNHRGATLHRSGKGFVSPFVVLFLVSALLSACGVSDSDDGLEIPATPVISVRESYAVIEQAYSPLHQDAESGSSILAQMRRGSVVEIVGRTANREQLDGRLERWYRVRYVDSEGWTFGGWIAVFETRGRAENYARTLLDE